MIEVRQTSDRSRRSPSEDSDTRAETAADITTASSAPELPYICGSGQRGRLHELSYAHTISTNYDAAAGEMIERGTCHCGQYVARFVFESQAPVASQVSLFPVAQLAAVVAGLADEPPGPELGSGVTCGTCHETDVTGAHYAGGCPQKLGAADPFGEGDVVRAARWGDAERVELSVAELENALWEGRRPGRCWSYLLALILGGLALLVTGQVTLLFGGLALLVASVMVRRWPHHRPPARRKLSAEGWTDQAALPATVEPLRLELGPEAAGDLFREGEVLPGAKCGDEKRDIVGAVEWSELSYAELENALWEGSGSPVWLCCFLIAVCVALILIAILATP